MFVLGLCDRWHCPPSVIYEQDADLIRMLKIEQIERDRRAREEDTDG